MASETLVKNIQVVSTSTLLDAMETIDVCAIGFCVVVDANQKVIGVMTDGDIRRLMLNGGSVTDGISQHLDRDFTFGLVKNSYTTNAKKLSKKIRFLPILDEEQKLVDIYRQGDIKTIPIVEPSLSGNELEYVTECFKHNWISSQGRFVNEFEEAFSRLHDGMFAVAVSNGTTALHLALLSLGVGKGDEVVVPSLTFAATANAIVFCGATPVFCDVTTDMTLDLQMASDLLTEKTKCILPVHLYGRIGNMEELVLFCRENDLLLVEDCAEALGSKWKNARAGTFGDASTFSFFGNKTITTGEGGMVLFQEEQVAQFARILRDHGMSKSRKYWHEHVGYNYRMTNLQAAVGVAQLERFDQIVAAKRRNAHSYSEFLSSCSGVSELPSENENLFDSFWLYTVMLDEKIDRDYIIEQLRKRGIDTRPVFFPLHQMPPYTTYRRSPDMGNSERYSTHGLCLPSSVDLGPENIELICHTLIEEILEYQNQF